MNEKLQKYLAKALLYLLSFLNIFGIHNINETWLLSDIPAYRGGHYCTEAYNAGTGTQSDWESCGTDYYWMQGVNDTMPMDFKVYTASLWLKGYRKVFENTMGKYEYSAYRKGDSQLYIARRESKNTVLIMDDSCSAPLDTFGYTYEPEQPATVYQYNLSYFNSQTCNDEDIYANNGMMYVIKLADNKVMIIDGGATKQWANSNVKNFLAFLHEITGTEPGEMINIALWYGTHPHSDHVSIMYKLIYLYRNEVNIERTMYNYPAFANYPYDQRAETYKGQLRNIYPDAQYVKCRTGYTCDIANVKLEVLLTHESLVDMNNPTDLPSTKANDASSVLRLTTGGKTFLFLGDADKALEAALLKYYKPEQLHCDVLQAAHHVFNNLKDIYRAIDADYVFVPQSMLRSTTSLPAYNTMRKYTDEENFFFADQGTYGLTPDGDEIQVTVRPYDSVPYDNTRVSGRKN